jgi:predicted anti-sigma-YlaC factor YlaD
MTEHVTHWLAAYADGELAQRRAAQVETHLTTCETCQTALAELQGLSSLLAEVPAVKNLTPPETFVAQVGLRLPRKSNQPSFAKSLRTGWRFAPVGLLGTWAFIQAALLVSGLITLGLRYLPIGAQIAANLPTHSEVGLLSQLKISGATFFEIGPTSIGIFPGGWLSWGLLINVGLSVTIGVLYLSWIASWWVQNTEHKNLTASNGF